METKNNAPEMGKGEALPKKQSEIVEDEIAAYIMQNLTAPAWLDFIGRSIGDLLAYGEAYPEKIKEVHEAIESHSCMICNFFPKLLKCNGNDEITAYYKKEYLNYMPPSKEATSQIVLIGNALLEDIKNNSFCDDFLRRWFKDYSTFVRLADMQSNYEFYVSQENKPQPKN